MKIEIPEDIVRRAEANAGDLAIALAVQLYADNRLDYRDACHLSGVSENIFSRELVRRHIDVQQYSAAQRSAG